MNHARTHTRSSAGLGSGEVARPQARVNSILRWVGCRVNMRQGREGEGGGGRRLNRQTMQTTVLSLSPSLGVKEEKTCSCNLISSRRPSDKGRGFLRRCGSDVARTLSRARVGVLARRVSGCAAIIPQVFGRREGP